MFLFAQPKTITGQVTDTFGDPLPGATILINGSNRGTASEESGHYRLELQPQDSVLFVNYLGYQSREMAIESSMQINIVLRENIRQLDEVVLWGYGQDRRRDLTGVVASLGRKAIQSVSVPAFQGALQGRLPGVDFTNASGGLNAEPIIRIRGVSSVSAGNQPLIVIDGLALSNETTDRGYGYRTNPLLNLDLNDIESVEVLKDPSTTALYGARGANGVILLTTRSGQFERPPRINIGYYAGFSEISRRYDLLNGREYAWLWNEAVRNADPNSSSELLYDLDNQPNTDWQNLILQKGFLQEATAGMSGGTPTTRYYFGGTYRDEAGFILTTRLRRFSFRTNIEQRIGKRFRVGLLLSPSRTVDRRVGNQFIGSAYGITSLFFPNVEAFDGNGNVRRDHIETDIGIRFGFLGNPRVIVEDQEVWTIANQVLFRGHLVYDPLPNLELKTEFSAQLHQLENESYFGATTFFGEPNGRAASLNQQVTAYTWNNLATYQTRWGESHLLDVILGTQLTHEAFNATTFSVKDFPSSDFTTPVAGGHNTGWFSWDEEYVFLGYLGRLAYQYQDRYLFALNARYDGSSRFGADNRYGFFPAVAAGWIVSDEPFFRVGWVDFLKLRGSVGLTGNAEIGNYAARGLVGSGNNYNGQPGFHLQSIESPDLSWEKNLQWDGALEFSLWNGRLQGSLGYYLRDTKDLLLAAPVPATNGITVLNNNVGEIRNQGLEFDLSTTLLLGPFKWKVMINGATLRNEVRQLADRDGDGVEEDIIAEGLFLFRPGESVSSFFLVKYAGVDPDNGNALFFDLEGNKTPNYSPSNRQVMGSALPRFHGGMLHTFSYRRFELSVFFQFKTGFQRYLLHGNILESNMSGIGNQLSTQLNAWRPDNRDTEVPQARLYQSNGDQVSTRYLHNADYLRLKTLTLAYTIPARKARLIQWRFFASVQNLLTITNFPGLDPDSEFYTAASATQGAVLANLPAARTFTCGVNLGF
ncbi:MAG: SusC/RagA family TonB-linked outer membrane protein [Saprospiraceae bacterium]|nr:MAG: SusC/RagA family TonB-linked outer membrane protein [Saprospiraceae bacterium]